MAATGIAGDLARLLEPAWWDWPAEHITQHLRVIMSGTVDDLEKITP
jgi:virginiamycin A acetyltransferase